MGYFSSKTNLETGTLSRKSSSASIKSEVKFNLDILDDLLGEVEPTNTIEKENQDSPNIEKKELVRSQKKNVVEEKSAEIDDSGSQPLADVNKSLKKKHVGFYTVFHGWSNRNKNEDSGMENKEPEKEKNIPNRLDSQDISKSTENLNIDSTESSNEKKDSPKLLKNSNDNRKESKFYDTQNQTFGTLAESTDVENIILDDIFSDKQNKPCKTINRKNENGDEKCTKISQEKADSFSSKEIYKDYFKNKDNTCDPISRLLVFDKMNIDTISSFNMQLDSLKLNIGNDYRLLNKWGVYLYDRKEKSFKRIFIKIENHEKLERLISMFARYKRSSSSEKQSYMISIEGEKPKNNSQEEVYCVFNIERKHGYSAIKTILRLILDDSIHLEKQYNVVSSDNSENSKVSESECDQESSDNFCAPNIRKIFLIIFAIRVDLHEENCLIKFYIKRKGLSKEILNGIISTFLKETMSNRLPEKIRYIVDGVKII